MQKSQRRLHSMACAILCTLLIGSVTGCSQPTETPAPISVLPSPQPTLHPTMQGFRLPEWMTLELPPKCSAGSVSQDSNWITYSCRLGNGGYRDWVAHIEAGQIISATDITYDPWKFRVGFSIDNSGLLILKGSDRCELLDLLTYSRQTCPGRIRAFSHSTANDWSPDGTSFIVASGPFTDVLISNLSNLNSPISIQKFEDNGTLFSWSPDSRALVFVDGFLSSDENSMQARIYYLDKRSPKTIFKGEHLTGASWSPNGKWIAVRELGDEPTTTIIHLIDLESNTTARYEFQGLHSTKDAKDGWSDLVWSPDSSRLVVDGWDPISKSNWIVIKVPSGKTVFRATEYASQIKGWDAQGKNLLITQWNSDTESDILKWIPVSISDQ